MKVASRDTAATWALSLLPFLLPQFFHTTTYADILKRLPECGDDQCHCTGADVCPSLPIINGAAVNNFRALQHTNPMTIQCDPFASTTCVQGLDAGEACVVRLSAGSGGETCPSGYTYELATVPSLVDALNAGEYVTHTGPCGACSSLQDLAIMIDTNQLPMRGNDCYWNSGGLVNLSTATRCYVDLGFTSNCARVLASYQNRINRKGCPSFCAAFALGQGQSSPACQESSVCFPCVTPIMERYTIVSGRTEINSGFPSWSASACSEIAPLSAVNLGDVCQEAAAVTPVGIMPVSPPASPVAPFTLVPTAFPSAEPSIGRTDPPAPAPTPNPTAPPTSRTSVSGNTQLCQQLAAIEISLSQRTGGSVVCDCSAALDSPVPTCYTSPDRTEDQVCAIQFGQCNSVGDCCNAGVRGCRRGQCRAASRTQLKSSLRIGQSIGRGGRGGGRVEAQPTRGEGRGRRRVRGVATSNNNHKSVP